MMLYEMDLKDLARMPVLHYLQEELQRRTRENGASRPIEVSDAMLEDAKRKALGEAHRILLPDGTPAPFDSVASEIRKLSLESLALHFRETADYGRCGESMTCIHSTTADEYMLFLFVVPRDETRVLGHAHKLRLFDHVYYRVGGWSYRASLRDKDSVAARLADRLTRALQGLRVWSVMLPYYIKGWRRNVGKD